MTQDAQATKLALAPTVRQEFAAIGKADAMYDATVRGKWDAPVTACHPDGKTCDKEMYAQAKQAYTSGYADNATYMVAPGHFAPVKVATGKMLKKGEATQVEVDRYNAMLDKARNNFTVCFRQCAARLGFDKRVTQNPGRTGQGATPAANDGPASNINKLPLSFTSNVAELNSRCQSFQKQYGAKLVKDARTDFGKISALAALILADTAAANGVAPPAEKPLGEAVQAAADKADETK